MGSLTTGRDVPGEMSPANTLQSDRSEVIGTKGAKNQVKGAKNQMTGAKTQVMGAKSQVIGTKNQVIGTK